MTPLTILANTHAERTPIAPETHWLDFRGYWPEQVRKIAGTYAWNRLLARNKWRSMLISSCDSCSVFR